MTQEQAMPYRLEFYRGIKQIAAFLGIHPSTVRDRIKDGTIPAKKDGMGQWVLANIDYYQSLNRKKV